MSETLHTLEQPSEEISGTIRASGTLSGLSKRAQKYTSGEIVLFTKSMRMCRVVSFSRGFYTVERLDTGKRMAATEDGLEAV